MAKIRTDIRIRGPVQRVWFRQNTKQAAEQAAEQHGVSGSCRNWGYLA